MGKRNGKMIIEQNDTNQINRADDISLLVDGLFDEIDGRYKQGCTRGEIYEFATTRYDGMEAKLAEMHDANYGKNDVSEAYGSIKDKLHMISESAYTYDSFNNSARHQVCRYVGRLYDGDPSLNNSRVQAKLTVKDLSAMMVEEGRPDYDTLNAIMEGTYVDKHQTLHKNADKIAERLAGLPESQSVTPAKALSIVD